MTPPPGTGHDDAHQADSHGITDDIQSIILKGRYLLGPELGRGGFAITYLATDTEVASRKVVIKILNERRSADSWSLKKFRSEMEALARIDHPNVVGVIDYGESADARPFLVMQFVRGKNLRSLIPREGLPLPMVAGIIRQIGQAITAAHEVGVIHRDIKPENIMIRQVTDGDDQVKLIDFGVSGIREADGRLLSTNISGTFSYMAPERYEGKSSPASDIYEMGIVAYEMVTGIVPFRAPTPGGIALQQMQGLSVAPSQLRPELPETAQAAILRALSPNPSDRFERAIDFGDALAAALLSGSPPSASWMRTGSAQWGLASARETTPAQRPRKRRNAIVAGSVVVALSLAALAYYRLLPPGTSSANIVAVLPFENHTGDAALAYLTEGITESLIDDLSRIPTLRVSARGSVMRYAGVRMDARAAGRELGASRVIDGSVSKRGDRFFVNTELLDVGTGARIWGNGYSANRSAISDVLQQFSSEVTDQLRMKLSGPLRERLKRQYRVGSKSYEQYLNARFHLNKRTASDFEEAIRDFEGVIATDPDYAPAHAGLADTYALMAAFGPFLGGAEPLSALERAKAAAKRALQLDGTLAEAYHALAMVEVQADYEWAAAERDYLRSIDLNPNFGATHEDYALELANIGRSGDAIREIKVAESLEPDNTHFRSAHGAILYMARKYDDSLNLYNVIAKTPAGAARVADYVAMSYWMKSMPTEALRVLEWIPSDLSELRTPLMITAHARLGQMDKARELLTKYDLHSGRIWWYYLAIAHLNLGRPEDAVRDLEAAYQQRACDVTWIAVEPLFDELHSNAGFRRLLERTKLGSTLP